MELHASGEGLGSLCWGIRLSQSKPFHIIGQGHLLSSRSGEAFPTNATQLARSSILCFTTLKTHPHLSLFSPSFYFFFPILASSLWFYLSCSLHPAKTLNSTSPFSHLTTLHLPPSLFIFFFFLSNAFFSVIGYALLRCVIGLYTLRWRNRPWSHYTSAMNPNECVCVCVCVCVCGHMCHAMQ